MPGIDPLWYKDAIFYEVHVRAFSDGDADGRGLREQAAMTSQMLTDIPLKVTLTVQFEIAK